MKSAKLTVTLVYEPGGPGQSFPLVRVTDTRLTVEVAKAAIREATERAEQLERHDEVLSAMERGEADRLRQILKILVPEVVGKGHSAAIM